MSVAVEKTGFHGDEAELRSFAGARAVRVVHAPRQLIASHAHEWGCITIPVLGGGEEAYDGGSLDFGMPAVAIHPARRSHEDQIGRFGLETISIQFDAEWLSDLPLRYCLDRSRGWSGGRVSAAGRALAQLWQRQGASQRNLRNSTEAFLRLALNHPPADTPPWIQSVVDELAKPGAKTTREIARRCGVSAAWLAHSYRAFFGEGIAETRRRRRVELAVALLRSSPAPLAEIASQAGFCDQSHMNRDCSAILRQTPAQIRREVFSTEQKG